MIMIIINAVMCAGISYTSFALLAHRHPPSDLRGMLTQGALAGLFAGYLAAAIMPFTAGPPHWWSMVARASGLLLALLVYDATFGLKHHGRLLRACIQRRLWR